MFKIHQLDELSSSSRASHHLTIHHLIAENADVSKLRVKVQFVGRRRAFVLNVAMAQQEYPKIITRPAKPPEAYGGLEVSLLLLTRLCSLFVLINAHQQPLSFSLPHLLQVSQAIEKWGRMRETTVDHFKFTPRTSAYAILWAVAVPFGLFSLIKWHRRRKDVNKGITPRKLF